MKYFKILIILLFAVHFTDANPPIDKGTWNISGEIYYRNIEEDFGYNRKYLNISPGIHYFFHKNFAFGSRLSYIRIWDDDSAVNYYKINPGVRLYFLTGGKIYPFLISSFEYYLADFTHRENYYLTYDLNYGCGVDFFISENVALEPYLVYHMTQEKDEEQFLGKSKMFEIGISMAIFIF